MSLLIKHNTILCWPLKLWDSCPFSPVTKGSLTFYFLSYPYSATTHGRLTFNEHELHVCNHMHGQGTGSSIHPRARLPSKFKTPILYSKASHAP